MRSRQLDEQDKVTKQDKVVEQEKLNINEAIVQPPALEVEASPTAKGPQTLAPEKNKAEHVETSAAAQPVSMVENAIVQYPHQRESLKLKSLNLFLSFKGCCHLHGCPHR